MSKHHLWGNLVFVVAHIMRRNDFKVGWSEIETVQLELLPWICCHGNWVDVIGGGKEIMSI